MIAKAYMINKDKKRRKLFAQYEKKKRWLNYLLWNTPTIRLKKKIHAKIQNFPLNSSISRIKNIDIFNGKAKSVYRKLGLSRHSFRHLALNGYLVGIKKSSW
jgi:small subunit ribosomal protein S14